MSTEITWAVADGDLTKWPLHAIHDLSPGTLWRQSYDRPQWAAEEPEACRLPEDVTFLFLKPMPPPR